MQALPRHVLSPSVRRSDAPTLRRSDAIKRIAVPALVKAIAALSLGIISTLPTHAQNPILANSTYYYTGAATINTDLGNNNIVIGRSPGNPPGPTNDINLGTMPETAYAVTVVDGAKLNYNSTGYSGVFNRNTLNLQGGIVNFIRSFDNSIVNVSGGQGGYPGSGSASFSITSFDSSTVNFNGATYCNQISAQDSATINVNGGNSNGSLLYVTGGYHATINVNAGADVEQAAAVLGASLNYNGGKTHEVIIQRAGVGKIFGGNIGSIEMYNASFVDVFGGVTDNLFTGIQNNAFTNIATIRGGNVGAITNSNFSTVNIFDGAIGSVKTFENSVTNIYGGTISPNTLYAKDNGVVNLFGMGFALTGALGTGSDGNGSYTRYGLTGTLQNGDLLNTTFYDYAGGLEVGGANAPITFNASAAPEPASLALLGLVGLPLVAGMVRRRKP